VTHGVGEKSGSPQDPYNLENADEAHTTDELSQYGVNSDRLHSLGNLWKRYNINRYRDQIKSEPCSQVLFCSTSGLRNLIAISVIEATPEGDGYIHKPVKKREEKDKIRDVTDAEGSIATALENLKWRQVDIHCEHEQPCAFPLEQPSSAR
jgi:hypothetical protein